MDSYGTTTTEPTLLHVIIWAVTVIALTYPLSVILMLLRVMKRGKGGVIFRANEILKEQLIFIPVAWVFAASISMGLLIVGVMVGGLLVIAGVMEPIKTGGVFTEPMFLGVGFLIHLACQCVAYSAAVRGTAYLTEEESPQ